MSEEILKKYKIKAKKSLGQNFLVNERIVTYISEVFDIKGQNIVEVGPGYGALTEKLLNQRPKSLTLVELDRNMISILNQRIEEKDLDISGVDFEILNKDVLKFTPPLASSLLGEEIEGGQKSEYSVIANIPYYITSPILRHFLYTLKHKPERMLILMQKDVGDKILSFKSSVISLMIAKKCRVQEEISVPNESFIPVPKVESSVLSFEMLHDFDDVDDEVFLKIIKVGFAAVRKKLVKNFVNGGYDKTEILEIFSTLGIHENARGEELNIKKWCRLVEAIQKV